jgi:hypothetical protein
VALAAVATPVAAAGWWATHGVAGPVQRATADFRPAVVSVQSQMPDQPRALILAGGAQTAIGYGIVRGAGASLGDADYVVPKADADRISALVGGLLSDSGGTELQGLASMGVRYVVGMKTLTPDYVRILDSTPGLNRQSQIEGVNLWKIATPAARLSLRGPGSENPKALQLTSADDGTMKGTLAPGGDGRMLVLAEDADSRWSAKVGGTRLKPTTVDGWAQGFELPAGASGPVTVSYSDVSRTAWLAAEGLFFLFALVMALPTGGRVEESGGPEQDEYVPPPIPVPAQATGVEDEAGFEQEYEPEYEAEYQAEYQADEYQADEYQSEYQAEEYQAQEYQAGYQTEHQAEYAAPSPAHLYATEYSGYQEPSYQDQYQDQYGQQADPYAQQLEEPYGYQQEAEPEEYGGYLRPGSGEYERPDFDTDDYGQGGYR